MRDRHHRGLRNPWMSHQASLERHRADPLAARLDEILGAIADLEVPPSVDRGDVARAEPAVGREPAALFLRPIVRGGDIGAAHLELAHRHAVPGYLTRVVSNPELQKRA